MPEPSLASRGRDRLGTLPDESFLSCQKLISVTRTLSGLHPLSSRQHQHLYFNICITQPQPTQGCSQSELGEWVQEKEAFCSSQPGLSTAPGKQPKDSSPLDPQSCCQPYYQLPGQIAMSRCSLHFLTSLHCLAQIHGRLQQGSNSEVSLLLSRTRDLLPRYLHAPNMPTIQLSPLV